MDRKKDTSPSKKARFDDNVAYIEPERLREVRANDIIRFHFHGFEINTNVAVNTKEKER